TLQRLLDYDSPQGMAQTFAGSLWATLDFTQAVDVETPFDYPLPHDLTWQTITLSDGTALPISRDYDPRATDIQAIDTNFDYRVIYNNDGSLPEGAALPDSITGQFTTTLPDAVLTATLRARESQTLGDHTVKLVEVDNHLAIIEISRMDGTPVTLDSSDVFVEAIDETGRYLDSFASSWGNPEQLQKAMGAFDDLIEAAIDGTVDDFSADAIDAEMIARAGFDMHETLYGQISFRGSVEKVEVTLLPPGEVAYTEVITLPAMAFNGQIDGPDIPELPMAGAVYDHDLASFLETTVIDIDPAEVDTFIIVENRNLGPGIRFNYPDVISTLFIGSFGRFDSSIDENTSFIFYDDAGNTINARGAFDFAIDRIELEPDKFPTPPARVTGQILVVVMTDIGREVFRPETDPEAIAILGNQVRVHRNQFRNWDSGHVLLARDSTGGLLKNMTIIRADALDGHVFEKPASAVAGQ
ncbi:MAG: hypothetical protein AAFY14_15750, partial [Pseudomonadota bacterium]